MIFRLGRLLPEPKGPGLFILIPIVDRMVKVDLRTITLDIPPQEVITKDNVPAKVNAVAYFRIVRPEGRDRAGRELHGRHARRSRRRPYDRCSASICSTSCSRSATRSTRSCRRSSTRQTAPWGIKVSIVEVKDVEIPANMQRAMARQAEAERERRAKVINAEGEFQASERLRDAAAVMAGEPIAIQLRYLQTLVEIGSANATTIVFPAPIDLIRPLLERAVPPKTTE